MEDFGCIGVLQIQGETLLVSVETLKIDAIMLNGVGGNITCYVSACFRIFDF